MTLLPCKPPRHGRVHVLKPHARPGVEPSPLCRKQAGGGNEACAGEDKYTRVTLSMACIDMESKPGFKE